ncbi:MAG: efflux RND transporter periplasmic adaptor subunit [Ignavibacteria bacterium]|nr:efflux RND transporter periplasmic adaptor subunit [Ignavibacteria bacterium]
MKKLNILILVLSSLIFSCKNSKEFKLETSGSIQATNIEIRAKITGDLQKILCKEGEFVHKNDTLFIIDTKEILLQYNQAVANYNSALAKYQTIAQGVRKEDIAQLREMVRQAQVNFDNAKKDFERIKNLFENQSVSQKNYDDAKLRYEVAEAQLKSAKENLQKAERGPLSSEIEAYRSAAEAAKAQVDLLKKKLDDAVIVSPSNGYVSLINFNEGELLTPGSLITKIVNLDEVYVKIYISENNLGKIQLGQKVEVKVDAFPDKVFTGEIVFISNEAEFTPKNIQTKEERVKLVYAVKVKIPNKNHLLKDGMLCDVILNLNQL